MKRPTKEVSLPKQPFEIMDGMSFFVRTVAVMNDKDFKALMELAARKLEEAKTMSKKEAIQSLNKAGILTKKGKFTKPYGELEKLVAAK